MTNANTLVIPLIFLIIAVTTQIVFMARWTGKVDRDRSASEERFNMYVAAIERRMTQNEAEILRLREARHKADGDIQRHEGWLRELDRRHSSRRATDVLTDTGD